MPIGWHLSAIAMPGLRWNPPFWDIWFFSVLRLCGSRQVVAHCCADERIKQVHCWVFFCSNALIALARSLCKCLLAELIIAREDGWMLARSSKEPGLSTYKHCRREGTKGRQGRPKSLSPFYTSNNKNPQNGAR